MQKKYIIYIKIDLTIMIVDVDFGSNVTEICYRPVYIATDLNVNVEVLFFLVHRFVKDYKL